MLIYASAFWPITDRTRVLFARDPMFVIYYRDGYEAEIVRVEIEPELTLGPWQYGHAEALDVLIVWESYSWEGWHEKPKRRRGAV